MENPQKSKNKDPISYFLAPKCPKVLIQKYIDTPMYIAAAYIIARI